MTNDRRIVVDTTQRIGAEVVSKLASIAFYVVFAREVGDSGFGIFTFALALAALVTTLANFGQDVVLIRDVASAHSRIERYLGNALALKSVLALAATGVMLAVATLAGMAEQTRLVFLVLAIAITLETLMSTFFAAFQAFARIGFISLILVCQRVLTAAVGITVLLLGGGVVAASVVYLGGAVLAFALAAGFFFGAVARPRLQMEPRGWWPLMRQAFPIGIGTVFATTLFRIDAAILALFVTNAVVGDYGAAYRLFEATLFITWSVGTAVFAAFARLGPDQKAELRRLQEYALKLAVAATLPIAVAALVLGTGIVVLVYGSAFEEGGAALTLLAPAIALHPIEHLLAGMLLVQHRQNLVAMLVGVVALGNIVANLALIPVLSLHGAALVTSLSEAALVAGTILAARRLTGGLDWLRIAAGPGVAAALAGIAMLALSRWLLIALVVGPVVYVVTLVVWERRRFPEDARVLSDLLLRRA
jgi:O-antigen/teichoic acid export membrane protein